MHVNHCLIIGRVSKNGPKLSYSSSGTPVCSLVVEVEEVGRGGETFTTYLPVEVTGKYAEQTATGIEPGDEIQVSGKLKYKNLIDQKSSQKTSKLIISVWGIAQRVAGVVSPVASPH